MKARRIAITAWRQRRDLRLLQYALLLADRAHRSDDRAELEDVFDTVRLTDHAAAIDAVGRAVLDRLFAREREDRARHPGDAHYVSPIAPIRARVESAFAAWRQTHPSASQQIRDLQAQLAMALADLDHPHAIVVRHYLGRPWGDRPEREPGAVASERVTTRRAS